MTISHANGSPTTDAALTADDRAELAEIAAHYPQPRSALLPMLHLVQAVSGYVTAEGIETCAQMLDLTAAEVSAVATFYTMFKRRPVGDYHVGVCTNTLCAVLGGDEIFERLKDHLDVGNDETTEDGRITLEHIECNAACDYAPVMMVNWEFFDNQTPQSAVDVVDDLRAGRPVTPTRGAPIVSWRDGERVLAGYYDGRADEGPAAGEASLVGLQIAREHGWTAPTSQAAGPRDTDGGRPDPATTGDTTDPKVSATDQANTSRAESEQKLDDAQDTKPAAERKDAQ